MVGGSWRSLSGPVVGPCPRQNTRPFLRPSRAVECCACEKTATSGSAAPSWEGTPRHQRDHKPLDALIILERRATCTFLRYCLHQLVKPAEWVADPCPKAALRSVAWRGRMGCGAGGCVLAMMILPPRTSAAAGGRGRTKRAGHDGKKPDRGTLLRRAITKVSNLRQHEDHFRHGTSKTSEAARLWSDAHEMPWAHGIGPVIRLIDNEPYARRDHDLGAV